MIKILRSIYYYFYYFRLTNGYKESKEKLLDIIKQKEEDVKEIVSNYEFEER
jgi:hypothetical protein